MIHKLYFFFFVKKLLSIYNRIFMYIITLGMFFVRLEVVVHVCVYMNTCVFPCCYVQQVKERNFI